MTGAYRFRALGWFAGCVAVVLGLYMVSLQVAAERQKLAQVNRAIVATLRDIRSLDTEFDTRASMAQLERWNGDVLALAAPGAGQFLRDERALAQSLQPQPVPAPDGQAPVQVAALVVPSRPAPVDAAIANTAPVPAPSAKPQAFKGTDAPRAVALLDHRLLSESTLGDLVSRASAEAGGH